MANTKAQRPRAEEPRHKTRHLDVESRRHGQYARLRTDPQVATGRKATRLFGDAGEANRRPDPPGLAWIPMEGKTGGPVT
jgi:hypothetical protein